MGGLIQAVHGLRRLVGDGGRRIVGMMRKEHTALARFNAFRQRRSTVIGRKNVGHPPIVHHRSRSAHDERGRSQGHAAGPGGRRQGKPWLQGCGQCKAPGPGAWQQKIGIPKRVLQLAVQRHQDHHDPGAARSHTARALSLPTPTPGPPQGPQQQPAHGGGQGQPQLHRKLQQQVVGVVKKSHRPARERRERPGKVELTKTHAPPRMHADQSEGVGPNAKARTRDVVFRQARSTAKGLL